MMHFGLGLTNNNTGVPPTFGGNASQLLPLVTCTRASEATYFNSDGKLALAGNNEARLSYPFLTGGVPSLLLEGPARTNYNNYARPQSGALGDHFTATPAGLSVVTDATAPITDDFTNHDQVWEFANTSGGAVDLEWNGNIGSTTFKTNAQVFYKITAGSQVTLSIGGAGGQALTSTDWARGRALNITPGATTSKLRLNVPNNTTVRFFMANMQRDIALVDGMTSHLMMPIDTNGSTASKALELANLNSLGSMLNDTEGTLVVHARLSGLQVSTARGLFGIFDQSSTLVRHAALYTDDVDLLLNQFNGSGSSSGGEFCSNTQLPRTMALAYTYIAAGSKLYDSGKETAITNASPLPTGLDGVALNYRPDATSNPVHIEIFRFEYYDTALTENQVQAKDTLRLADELRVLGGGQSNIAYQFTQYSGAGETAFENVTRQSFHNTNTFMNGAVGGTALHKDADTGSGHWWDTDTNSPGTTYATFLAAADLHGRNNIKYVLWGQGETDAAAIKDGTITKAQYKAANIALFNQMRADLGTHISIFIQMIGPTTVNDTIATNASWQDIRDTQLELIDEYSWIERASEHTDLTYADSYHLDQAGFEAIAARNGAVFMAAEGKSSETGTQGPYISSAEYSGNTVTITVTQDGGATLSGSETGTWRVEDDGTPATIISVTYPQADTIQLNLGGLIGAGSVVNVWHCYGKMATITAADVCKDDAGMPLQAASEVAALEANFNPMGAAFDGTNDWLGEASGVGSGATWSSLSATESEITLSVWINCEDALSITSSVLGMDSNGATKLNARIDTTDFFDLQAYGSVAQVLNMTSDPTDVADGTWTHLYVAYQSGGALKMYINGASVVDTTDTGTLKLDVQVRVGAINKSILNLMNGYISELWFDNTYYDPATYISRFYNAGYAVNLGLDGAGPTGSQPIAYMRFADGGDLGVNSGVEVDLDVHGAPAQVAGPNGAA